MKRILAFSFGLLLALQLVACGGETSTSTPASEPETTSMPVSTSLADESDAQPVMETYTLQAISFETSAPVEMEEGSATIRFDSDAFIHISCSPSMSSMFEGDSRVTFWEMQHNTFIDVFDDITDRTDSTMTIDGQEAMGSVFTCKVNGTLATCMMVSFNVGDDFYMFGGVALAGSEATGEMGEVLKSITIDAPAE